jgi:hypothetical protein
VAIQSGNQGEVWIRRYEPKLGDKDSEPTALVVDKAGNIYVTGFIDTAKNDVDFITIKYSPDGSKLWESRYNGTGNDADWAHCIAVHSDGSVYVTGESLGPSGSGPGEHNELDIVTLKYDGQTGKQVKEDRYDGPGHGADHLAATALDGNGHLYVFGTTWEGSMENGADGHGFVLIQYDTNLNRRWTKRYYDSEGRGAGACAMILDPAGFAYVTAVSGNDTVIRKYDTDGNVKWTRTRMTPQNTGCNPFRILRDHDGSLYVICQVVRSEAGAPRKGFVQVLKYDSNGELLRDKTYWEDSWSFCCAAACNGGTRIYIVGATNAINKPFSQALLTINTEGVGSVLPFCGPSLGNSGGNAVVADRHNFVHTTGQAHFIDSEGAEKLLASSSEATTLTYHMFGRLLRVRRYAGSKLLMTVGGKAIAVDDHDNIIVAGQTQGGKSNDIFVVKYPP